MKITQKLKDWLVEHKGVESEADEAEFKAKAGEAIVSGELTAEQLAEFTKDPDAEGESQLTKMIREAVRAEIDASKPDDKKDTEPKPKPELSPNAPRVPEPKGGDGASQFDKLFSQSPGAVTGDEPLIRVKGAHEQYDGTKSVMRYPKQTKRGGMHAKADMPVEIDGRTVETPSQRDKAVFGAFFKWNLSLSSKMGVKLTDHEKDLVQYALHDMEWGGVIGAGFGEHAGSESPGALEIKGRKLSDYERKALLDDGSSGGLEAAPIVFDDMLIETPLLHGELFPLVELVPITRGRRIEGVSVGNVTVSWGGADGSTISLFNTASFVSAFDTTIFAMDGAIEVGLDFLSDTPLNFAEVLRRQYNTRALKELDEVITSGDGSTQPEGIFTASGTTSVSFGSTTATVGGYEQLLFGVAKEFRTQFDRSRNVFVSNETSYRRARAIPVGGSDARRVFGMTHQDYMLLDQPYKIDDNLANTRAAFCAMPYYRMYRRMGTTIDTTSEGKTLKRDNTLLVVFRARWGGALTLGGACAKSTTLEG